MKIAFIGGGNMGTAILSALLDKGLAKPDEITVNDIMTERLEYLKKTYDVEVTTDKASAIEGKEVILLSVKPQTVPEIIPDLKGKVGAGQLIISIMAGIKILTLRDGLDCEAIVRVMPNTPAQVFEGMSGWTTTPEVSDDQKELARSILQAIGREQYFGDEKYLDMVTSVSGSGPAYFFYFVEALTEAGVKIGFAHDVAYELVLQTLIGAGKLMRDSGTDPAELRNMVTSKGGTTAAALDVLESDNYKDIVVRALMAAYNRSKELGGEK
ncbi:MAG: pyrroline-5-carboxylate reductase [Dehalococcoidales bacterium]|nr:MAG: pyrroline-5-carboxylate reductase [Dehalococcoidales bacterium]